MIFGVYNIIQRWIILLETTAEVKVRHNVRFILYEDGSRSNVQR